jgi:hypothetical protein
MQSLFDHDELTMGDKGYQGSNRIIVPFKRRRALTERQKAFNSRLSKVRILVEHTLARVKNFQCLRTPWRHSLYKHPIAFHVCAQITNIGLRLKPVHVRPSRYI